MKEIEDKNILENTSLENEERDRTLLLYQYGGLKELDYDYYQGECPEN
jgi:hypothetical protein